MSVLDDAGLGPRGREVMSLLSEGLSDAQIASRLAVSTRTAETLVRKVLARTSLRRAEISPRLRGTDRDGLTRRQREVIELVRQGNSDQEIAAQLGVGLRTAESHVGAALRKLGRHDRHEL